MDKKAGGVLDAITWHDYPLDSQKATNLTFVDRKTFDKVHKNVDLTAKYTDSLLGSDVHRWLFESGASYNAFTEGMIE